MALDPRVNLIDGQSTGSRTATRIADLDRRLKTLEQARPTIQVVSGTPSTAPRAGTPVADAAGSRFGVYLPSAGGWKFVTLT